MTPDQHIEATEQELSTILELLADADLSAEVPTCDGWRVADLARHIGDFCGFWAHVLCDGTGRSKADLPGATDDAELPGHVSRSADALVAELRATPSHTEVWTWYEPDRTAAFVARRCAHELAVHRLDLQAATGSMEPIPTELAVDGVDEILGPLVTVRHRTGDATGQTIHLHGTDSNHAEWLVRLLPDRISVTREHAKGDLALRGSVSDLELVLLDRPTLGEVERFGDDDVLHAWYREFRF